MVNVIAVDNILGDTWQGSTDVVNPFNSLDHPKHRLQMTRVSELKFKPHSRNPIYASMRRVAL